MRYFLHSVLLIGLFVGTSGAFRLSAQETKVQGPEVVTEAAEKPVEKAEAKDDPKDGDSPGPKTEGKSRRKRFEKGGDDDSDNKPATPSGEPTLEEPSSTKQRPLKPELPPNPEELKARPSEDGKVRFNFRGQPWPDVLNWLAEVSEMSFDWQELPGDYLNLVTQRGYSIEEARDLINRHLLARGYTMLESDELLTVVNVKKLDAGMVPRVEPKDLVKRRPHEFVKVSFPLEWIVAESAVEELKPMLSPNGKLASLKSTNRLEAMDAVINLREIYKVIGQEQSDIGQEKLVREFDLQHAKAEEVYQQLQKLLGIEERQPTATRPPNGAQMQQLMQQQQEMLQQLQQRPKGGAPNAGPQKPEINLVVNVRRNSILARANPEKMAVIGQAIKMLDVPLEQSQTIQGSIGRMQVYRLSGLEPSALVKTLEESGGLDPTTRLQVDEKNKAIIAHATLSDHVMIRKVIDKLDGSNRKFEVVTLRKLGAEYVAGSIEFMFNGGNEDKQARRPSDEGNRRNGQNQEADKFRVDADTENNRLLLWANEMELQQVKNLLMKLGEIPDPRNGPNLSRIRVLSIQPRDAEEWLNRLRRTWPTVAPNPLIVPEQKPDPEATETPAAPTASPPAADRKSKSTQNSTGKQPWQAFVQLAQLKTDKKAASAEDEVEPSPNNKPSTTPRTPREFGKTSEPPPVRVEIGPDGRLIISSQDTEALDRMEELAEELAPERRDYQVFKMKHAPAYWVRLNLVEFFEEEDKSKKDTSRRNYYYFEAPVEKKDPRQRLSKRKSLKFISDSETNTIVVLGADSTQLRTIAELIELYDRPDPANSKTARMTTVVQINYSKAQTVADAVKEVYRDLLSANDKALAQPAGDQRRPQQQNSYISGEGDQKDKRTAVSFKGKLSIGVDEISNTLLVSADGENLLNNVLKMVESLDTAAKPNSTVHVVKIGGGVNSFEMKRVLTGLLADQTTQGSAPRPNSAPQQPQGGQRIQRNGR